MDILDRREYDDVLFIIDYLLCIEWIEQNVLKGNPSGEFIMGTDDVQDTHVRGLFITHLFSLLFYALEIEKLLMYVLFIIEHERKEYTER